MSILKIKNIIEVSNKFLISSHINPEGDSIGSQLALASFLKRMGKDVIMVDESPVPKVLQFMNGSKDILKKMPQDFNYEIALVLDCPDLSRIGYVSKYISSEKTIINIDHHVSNTRFGKYNWVDSKCSSVGEMIFKLIKKFNTDLNYDEALALYVAIMTDTGSFKYTNTTSLTHKITSALLKKGIEPYKVYSEVHESASLEDLSLLAESLKSLKVSEDGLVAWMWITKKMLLKTKASLEGTEGIINFARSLKGVEVAMLFRETGTKDRVKLSFRSKGKVDVNKLASFFNGGGHKTASGATIFGKLKAVEKKVLDKAIEMSKL